VSKKPLTIWFTAEGEMLNQSNSWELTRDPAKYQSEEAKDFTDRMEYLKILHFFKKGTRVQFRSLNSGRVYSMFILDFDKIIQRKLFVDNRIQGTFCFVKIGSAQAIKMFLPDDDNF
jgi:hypothetical protein